MASACAIMACQLGNSAMKTMKTIEKTVAVSILAFAIVATSVIGTAMVLNLQSQPAAAAEPCIGLGCWPPNPPVKHRPAQRATLPPVW
jgi:hypothetical protein